MLDATFSRLRSYSGIAAAFLLCLAWLNPSRYLPWPGFYSEAPAAIALALVILAAGLSKAGRVTLPPLLAVGLLGTALLPLIQAVGGAAAYRGDGFLAALYLASTALAAWIGRFLHSETPAFGDMGWLLVFLLTAAVGSSGIGIAQWIGVAPNYEWIAQIPGFGRIDSNVGQANHFATICLFALLAAGYLRATERIGSASLAVVALWLTTGMALAQSRTSWVAALVLLAWALARRRTFGASLGVGPAIAAAAVTVYAAVFAAGLWLPEALGLVDVADQGRFEAGGRPTLWAQMLAAIRESPWIGYGWLQGHTAQMVGALEHPGREFTAYSHNLVLDLMVWNGVPLGLLFSALLIAWYIRTGLRVDGPADAFRFAVVTVFGVHCMLEYPFAYLYFIVPVGLLAGQLCRPGGPGDWRWRSTARAGMGPATAAATTPTSPASASEVEATEPRGLAAWGWSALFLALVVAWSAAGLAIARDYLLAEHDRREVQMVLARIGGVRPFPPQPDLWVLDQLEASARNARREIRAGMPADELDDLARITRRYPTAFFLRTSAAAWALNGDVERALLDLRRLRSIHGEPAWQGSLLWLEQTAQEKAWPLDDFLQRARSAPLR